ncbi:MAG TPA: peptidoglycan DD-metalloendopeptidase family protein [Caulobacteraceae bacterium]|nr:peptidoglycan DD-metalloendopeptidase family protein [Caulobacteraceae bacterium]
MAETDRAAQANPGEGVATMTAFWVRTAAAAASVLTLQACTMPHSEYPPSEDYQTPAALQAPKPQYPVTQDQPPPAQSADPHDPVASPTPPVTAQPLPPPAPTSEPTADFGPRPTYAVEWTQPLQLWQAARHRRVQHERARTHVDARGRLEAAGEAKTVRIRKGDTLRLLAKRYGTTARALMKANGIRHPGDLAVGEPIVVPGAPAALTRRERRAEAAAEMREVRTRKTYRAHKGDTIYSIGRRFKISPKTIETLNGFTQKTRLKTGELVRLPGSEVEVAEERTPPRVEPSRPVTEAPSSEAARSMTEPDHPIPYAELPGHLEGPNASYAPVPSIAAPPERPIVPPVAQPQPLGPPDASVLMAGRGRFVWPVRGTVFSGFGPKAGGQRSDGIDIAAPLGTPVMAAATGDVVYAGALPELGNLVLVKHQDGWITAYAHLSKTEVRIKDHVTQGQEVGQAGQSGSAAQSEVYFEIRYAPTPRDKARPVDPALLLASQ